MSCRNGRGLAGPPRARHPSPAAPRPSAGIPGSTTPITAASHYPGTSESRPGDRARCGTGRRAGGPGAGPDEAAEAELPFVEGRIDAAHELLRLPSSIGKRGRCGDDWNRRRTSRSHQRRAVRNPAVARARGAAAPCAPASRARRLTRLLAGRRRDDGARFVDRADDRPRRARPPRCARARGRTWPAAASFSAKSRKLPRRRCAPRTSNRAAAACSSAGRAAATLRGRSGPSARGARAARSARSAPARHRPAAPVRRARRCRARADEVLVGDELVTVALHDVRW